MVVTGYIHLYMSKAKTWGDFLVSCKKVPTAVLYLIIEKKEQKPLRLLDLHRKPKKRQSSL